tara:strand:+ start:1072 stop:1392 length:321 start_codon:yes stop_codon:yes gene_type:complete
MTSDTLDEDYVVHIGSSRHAYLKDLDDKTLKNKAHKSLHRLRQAIVRVAAMKSEFERRGEDAPFVFAISEFNIFQISTHATVIGVRTFNEGYPDRALVMRKEEEEE